MGWIWSGRSFGLKRYEINNDPPLAFNCCLLPKYHTDTFKLCLIVSTFNIGDEVYFSGSLQRPGAYAEYTLVNHELLAIKPKTVDHVVAASMPLTALTALQAFEKRLHLSIPVTDADIKAAAAKSILITAGAGGVGSIAIQLAKRVYKLGTVIATASRADSIAWCKDQGADIVIDRSGDWTSQLTSHGINSVDLFLVCSQFEGMEESILSLASQGAFICGIAPTQVNINLGRVFYKALSIGFLFMLPIGHGTHLKLLASLVDDGAIKPWIGKKYDIATEETIREGHKALSTGATIGKISYAAIFP